MLKIEYVIEVQSFLEDISLSEKINRFRKFLNMQPEFSLRSAKLKYRPLDYTVHYNLDLIKETNDFTTFQQILYTKQKDENYIQNLNTVSENLHKIFINNQEESDYILYVTKTYDEISKSLCLQGYSLIYEIENSLRKIIAKSLYLKYGNKWFENIGYFPKIELRNANKTKHGKIINPLEAVELDQLRIIIFEEAPLLANSRIADLLKNNNQEDIVSLKEKFIPLSNWERTISKIFENVKKEQLHHNLVELNSKYRRLIAHNRTFTYKEYTDLKKNYEFISRILKIALENLIETVQLNINEEIEIEKLENAINVKNLPRVLAACKMFNIGRDTLEDILNASKKDFGVDDFYGNRKLTKEEMSILINARLPIFSNKIFFDESLEPSNSSYKISENTWILNFEKSIEKFLFPEQSITQSKKRIPHIIKQLSKKNRYQ